MGMNDQEVYERCQLMDPGSSSTVEHWKPMKAGLLAEEAHLQLRIQTPE